MELAKWTRKSEIKSLPKNAFPINTSLEDGYAMSIFDPRFPHGGIPLPYKTGKEIKHTVSDSVQGIWEALAIVNGRTDSSKMKGVPEIGRATPECFFVYEDKYLKWIDARQSIFIPSLIWQYEHKIPKELKLALYGFAKQGIVLYFYDNSDNPDPVQMRVDYSHSALLVYLLNKDFRKLGEVEQKFEMMSHVTDGVDFSGIEKIYGG